ncbi:MAG: YdiU family protein [Bdellovibrionota bacterium]
MKAQFDNSFSRLPAFLFERVEPTPIKNPKLIHVTKLKEKLGLKLSDEELTRWLNGELRLPGEQRIATRYAGHQFGHWAGQLGDGRAISLGEIITEKGHRLEVQTKGSGLTPFSRMGDGKAVIRSSVREYLCSEAMAGLQIPTTGVLAILTGEDEVYRETIENSSIVARVFPSNLRFGHFEMLYHYKKDDELKALITYTRETFFGGISVLEMLTEIVKRTAHLMADWMSVGFCHGVMNTDNMSVLGLTIDYGPFGFMEDTDLNFICNHSDEQGRYAYGQQPGVAQWNLSRLLACFTHEVEQADLQKLLDSYPEIFQSRFTEIGKQKLGLINPDPIDQKLFLDLLQVMGKLNLDFTYTFHSLSTDLKDFRNYYGKREEFESWLLRYEERLVREETSDGDRKQMMRKRNPKYILRNYIAQEVIEDVEAGISVIMEKWLNVFSSPYEDHPHLNAYAMPTPYEKKNIIVSCSS